MRKITLKINPARLEIRPQQLPVGKEIRIFKISYSEAMNYSARYSSFEMLLAKYGEQSLLKEDEFYDGYALVVYPYIYPRVVKMYGKLQPIPPHEANSCFNANFAKIIRSGDAWKVVAEGGEYFQYVWSFNDCQFARSIKETQESIKKRPNTYNKQEREVYETLDAVAVDATLKQKIVTALLTKDKIVELAEAENMVLRHYLGEYYYRFFTVVE